MTALRLARAVLARKHRLDAVFFRGEGVYNALTGTEADPNTPELARSWSRIAEDAGTELMVCQSSARRRLNTPPEAPFRDAGLAEFIDRVERCDRVVTL